MHSHEFRVTLFWIGVVSLVFIIQGCGGKSGGSSTGLLTGGVVPTITGTAAMGAPITNAVVTIKDQNGTSRTGTTDDNGKYSIDVTGMTPPFLLKLDSGSGTSLYSVGMQVGNINIHPYTNLMIGTWYQLEGLKVEDAFSRMGSSTPVPVPSALEVSTLSRIIKTIVHKWLLNQNISIISFDLISTPFDVNGSGFDGVLALSKIDPNDTVTIQDSNSTQISTLSLDSPNNTVTVHTSTTTGQVATNTVTSFVIPTTTELQSVLKGVNDALMDVVTTANTKGGKLADTDLAVYFDDEYLQDGFGKDIGTAELATLLRGVAQDLKTFTVYRILSYDNVHKVIQIVAMFSWTQDGKTLLRLFDKGGSGLYFKLQKQQDGSVSCPCLIFGNQQIASVAVQGTTVNTMSGDSTNGVSQIFQLQVIAPTGTLTSDGVQATVGSMPPYTLTKWSNVLVDTITSAQKDVFTNLQDVTQTSFPLLGTSAAFTLNTVSGQPQTYSYPAKLEATTTEAIQITNLEGYTLADANLGNPLTVDWTLPTSFPIGRVELTGLVTAGGYVCKVYSRVLGPAATSGTITLPTTCQGNNVASGEIQVSVWGVNEEQTQVQYYFN